MIFFTETDEELIYKCKGECRLISYDTNPPFLVCSAKNCRKEENRTIRFVKEETFDLPKLYRGGIPSYYNFDMVDKTYKMGAGQGTRISLARR